MPEQDEVDTRDLFEVVLDALAHPVFILDLDSIVYVNRAAGLLLRCPDAAQLRGEPVKSIIHPDSVDASAARRRLVIENRNHFRSVCLKLRALDGSCARLTSDVQPIEHNGEVLVMATVTEVD